MSHLENTTPLPQKQPQEIEQWLLNVLDATTTGGKVELGRSSWKTQRECSGHYAGRVSRSYASRSM